MQPPAGMYRISDMLPSTPSKLDSRPGRSDACSTTAPAPSPNSTQVSRLVQSVTALSFSAPITRAVLTRPDSMAAAAVSSAIRNPAQAEERSNP